MLEIYTKIINKLQIEEMNEKVQDKKPKLGIKFSSKSLIQKMAK